MVPSKIKIESFAKRYHMGTLGGKGLKIRWEQFPSERYHKLISLSGFLENNCLGN